MWLKVDQKRKLKIKITDKYRHRIHHYYEHAIIESECDERVTAANGQIIYNIILYSWRQLGRTTQIFRESRFRGCGHSRCIIFMISLIG